LVKKSARLPLKGDSVRLVAVADTHSHPHANTARRLAELAPAAILHGGDIGDRAVLDQLAEIAPVYAVRGNIDADKRDLPDVLTLDVGALRILLTHIAVYGPRLRGEIAKLAKADHASLVVCGHSHVPFIGRDQGVTVFNPGSIGPRRFSLPIVLGTIDVSPAGIRLQHIDAETGAVWLPP
jgi:putative phosphoesterase